MVLTVPLAAAVTTAALVRVCDRGRRIRHAGAGAQLYDARPADGRCRLLDAVVVLFGACAGQGLTMPADVAMYPILPAGRATWNVGEQREHGLGRERGEADARLAEFADADAISDGAVAEVAAPARSVAIRGDKLRVKNQLGTKIETCSSSTKRARFMRARTWPTMRSAVLQPIERDDAVRLIEPAGRRQRAASAGRLGTSDIGFCAALQSRSQVYGRYGVQYNGGRLSENLAGSRADGPRRVDRPAGARSAAAVVRRDHRNRTGSRARHFVREGRSELSCD